MPAGEDLPVINRKCRCLFQGDRGVGETAQITGAHSTVITCEGEWTRILGQLKAEVGEDAYRNWLLPMNLDRVDDGKVIILAPTRLLRDWVTTHYADRLLALWHAENDQVTRVSVVLATSPKHADGGH